MVRLHREGECLATTELDVTRQAVDPGDAPGLGPYPARERSAGKPVPQRSYQPRLRQPRREGGVARVAAHEPEQLGEGQWAHQVAAREAGAVAEGELGRIHLDRVYQEAALDFE